MAVYKRGDVWWFKFTFAGLLAVSGFSPLAIVGCGHVQNATGLSRFSKCERLEIWKAVHTSTAFAKVTSEVIKNETGRDEYQSIYMDKLSPTLKRYGIDRLQALQIFEQEGGWPY